MSYKLQSGLGGERIVRLRDGAVIPIDPLNADYADVLRWLASGNTLFPADVSDCHDLVEEGGVWSAQEKPIEHLRALWRGRLAARRWAAEEKGIEINGAFFASDAGSQGKLTGAALAAVIDNAYTVQWKTGAGFITLTATQIIAAAQAVRAHVQACFDHEADVAAEIDAADTLAELQAIDVSAGWPG
jgi:hypothetical protein